MPLINVIIPAYNEENSIAKVIQDIPLNLAKDIIVVDNNSQDNTYYAARQAGATVLKEPRQGYGQACLTGIAYALNKPIALRPDIIVFLDGDYSDHPEEMPKLVQPILDNKADLVIGSRALGNRQRGAM